MEGSELKENTTKERIRNNFRFLRDY